METLTLTVLPEDLENCGRYTDTEHCLIATALQRSGYPKAVACVRHASLIGYPYFDEHRWHFPDGFNKVVHKLYRKEVELPLTVTLTLEITHE